jgi:serine/threonine protein kinase
MKAGGNNNSNTNSNSISSSKIKLLFLAPSVQAGWEKESHITDFKILSKLGNGSFGTVYEAKHKKTNKVYAIKEIKKSALDSKKLLEHVRTEVKIMYSLNHPNIIKLYNHFEDEVSIFLVLEFAVKGQLYTLLRSQPDRKF